MRNDSYDLNRLPSWPLVIKQLPTKSSFVKDGDFTLRYGLAYDAVRINGHFKGAIMLRMKLGTPGKGQSSDDFDEYKPRAFSERYGEYIHPYLNDLLLGNYVIEGGAPEERKILKLKSRRNNDPKKKDEPPMRCYVLGYDDLRRWNGDPYQFEHRNFPMYLMSSAMELQGKFEHNPDPDRELFSQAVFNHANHGLEEILIGAKPRVFSKSINLENNTVEVSRPGWIAVLRDNFYERFCVTEETIHEGYVKPAMEMFAEIEEQTYGPASSPIPVDLRGLGPLDLLDSYDRERIYLERRKKTQSGVKLSSDPPAPPSSPDVSA